MPILFAATLFLSALLLFSIQLILAKMVLPSFGGTPAVWNTCMVFFQALLLGGYGYTYWLTRGPNWRRQPRLHLGLVLLGTLLAPLPILVMQYTHSWAPSAGNDPVLHLLGLLFVSAGVPFLVLSATAPLLQRWYADSFHPTRDPYYLYGASNLGSLIALLGYPLLLEPLVRLPQQAWLWAGGYLLLAALLVTCAVVFQRSRPRAEAQAMEARAAAPEVLALEDADTRPAWSSRFRWLILSYVPSSLLFGVTTYLSTDVAALPLLWVVPLAIYLIGFIVAFAQKPLVSHRTVVIVLPMAILVQMFVFNIAGAPLWIMFSLHLSTFFVMTLACLGELADSRPAPLHLAEFYLWLSLGGVLGGLFNTFIAPLVFPLPLEYPLALVLVCLIVPGTGAARKPTIEWLDLWIPLLQLLVLSGFLPWFRANLLNFAPEDAMIYAMLLYGLPATVCYFCRDKPLRFGMCVAAFLLAGQLSDGGSRGTLVMQSRNFFGSMRVVDVADPDDKDVVFRRFVHGATLHGMQRMGTAEERLQPLTYYFSDGAISQIFASHPSQGRRIAVLGLGVGTLAAYAQQGEEWTFHEIDPAVRDVARDYFTFLQDAEQRGATMEVILGDARLQLANAPAAHYAMIFADAFSSDAVPAHLLTREAVQLYLDKLAPDGLLVVNITNRCLDLEPLWAALGEDAQMEARIFEESAQDIGKEEARQGKTPSRWIVLARKTADLGVLATDPRWRSLHKQAGLSVWTDDFSNLIEVIRW